MTIELSEAVNVRGNMTTTVEVKTPKVGHEEDALEKATLIGRGSNTVTLEMCLFSELTGIAYDTFREMNTADYNKVREAVNSLIRPTIQNQDKKTQKV